MMSKFTGSIHVAIFQIILIKTSAHLGPIKLGKVLIFRQFCVISRNKGEKGVIFIKFIEQCFSVKLRKFIPTKVSVFGPFSTVLRNKGGSRVHFTKFMCVIFSDLGSFKSWHYLFLLRSND